MELIQRLHYSADHSISQELYAMLLSPQIYRWISFCLENTECEIVTQKGGTCRTVIDIYPSERFGLIVGIGIRSHRIYSLNYTLTQ